MVKDKGRACEKATKETARHLGYPSSFVEKLYFGGGNINFPSTNCSRNDRGSIIDHQNLPVYLCGTPNSVDETFASRSAPRQIDCCGGSTHVTILVYIHCVIVWLAEFICLCFSY